MDSNPAEYEVEFRCRFSKLDEAYRFLPFLQASLTRRMPWNSTIYGLELFQSGKLLRIGGVIENDKTRYYMTFKGPDIGKFCNIRLEIEQELTDSATDSPVLRYLGGRASIKNKDEAARELELLGYHPFMSWSGVDIMGFYEPYSVKVKLMTDTILDYPYIVEIEKIAATEEEAYYCEKELYELSRKLELQERIFREEPPQLLYEKVFGPGAG